MSNKINKQLKKGSPLFDLGQGISNLIDFESIGAASNPNRSTGTDLLGRGMIHLGSLFSKMDEDFDPGEKIPEEVQKPVISEELRERTKEVIPGVKIPIKGFELPPGERYQPTTIPERKRPPVENKEPVQTTERTRNLDIIERDEVSLDTTGRIGLKTGEQVTGREDISDNDLKREQLFNLNKKNPNTVNTLPNLVNTPTETGSTSGLGNYNYDTQGYEGTGETSIFNTIKNKISGYFGFNDDVLKRLMPEEHTPLERHFNDNPGQLEAFKALRYRRKHKGESPLRKIAHLHASPFVKTDAGPESQTPNMQNVDYRYAQRAYIPSYAEQGFGQAAAEGFNLAIDRANYKKAVQADYDKEVEDTMGELVIDTDYAGDAFNKQKLDIGLDLKRQAYNDMIDYTKGNIDFAEKQFRLEKYKNRAKVVEEGGNVLAQLAEQVQTDKGMHDLNASKPEIVAFYNTLKENPGSFKLQTIDGQEYIVGKTIVGGKPADDVKLPLAQIASGKAGLKLVPKVNPQVYVDAANKTASGYIKEYATKYGIGKGNVPFDQIKPRIEQYFMSVIGQDETKLRSLAAQLTEGKFDYDGYEQMINIKDPDQKKANMQAMQMDIVQDLMQDFQAQYFPESVTTRFDPAKTGITPASTTKEGTVDARNRRDTEAYAAKVDSLGEITPENVSNLIASGGGKVTNARFDEQGRLQLKVGKTQYSLSADPAIRRQQLILIMGGKEQYIK